MDDVRTLVVIGAGTMGHGIAHVAAVAGLEVTLVDVAEGAAERGLAKIRENLQGGVARGKLGAREAEAAGARLRAATSPPAADVIIEAVPEDLALKQRLLGPLEARLVATNTSSLSVAAIASACRDPGRVVGMHFFNPVHVMKLVEVVRHPGAAPEAVALAVELSRRFGKTPITVEDSPGFASSRLGVLLGLEAIRMLEAGVASAEDIDTAMKLGYGHPMGPLELGDHVGLDVRLAIAEHLAREVGPQFEPPALLRQKVAEKKLGKKTGEGFYRWPR
jgi:3-hydroxybutyryl-CoA dehydrogenase